MEKTLLTCFSFSFSFFTGPENEDLASMYIKVVQQLGQ